MDLLLFDDQSNNLKFEALSSLNTHFRRPIHHCLTSNESLDVKVDWKIGKTISLYRFRTVELSEDTKEFLEEYSGDGRVVSVDVDQAISEGSRTKAKVQFTTSEAAQKVKLRPYLKVRDMDYDIVPTRMAAECTIDNITLHFGCQVSEDKFYALWRKENVSVNFGFVNRKIYLFLTYLSAKYKLELSYENIWQIELHRPRGQTKKFLIVQMLGGPKILKKDTDNQWVRDVDFSPSYCIGQSSALCLELPRSGQLPNFQENFPCYKEDDGHFFLEVGPTFCRVSDLVPILREAQGIELPYDIVFKVNSLVQHGYLPGPALDANFYRLINPSRVNIAHILHALEKLHHSMECCYDPVRWLRAEYQKCISTGRLPPPPAVAVDDGLVHVRRVQITPTKVYFRGPEVNLSNRVLRKYPDDIDNFLRVSFVDEDLDKLFSTNISPRTFSAIEGRQTKIYQRILSTQRNGIVIGSKKFEFLGFSSSQLRESSLWMFASRTGLRAADIREWMGDFREIRNVAKYAARLGQSFGSSRESFNIDEKDREIIPDIEVRSGGVDYVFSDGIGKISAELANSIAQKFGFLSFTPSAFQIRYGGYKGVVAVDPNSSKKLSLRKSMSKYKSTNTSLDILAWSKYQACYLNREVITLLSTLGVRDHIFQRKQNEAIAQLNTILTDPSSAQEALQLMAPGETTKVLKEMLACGYKPDAEPFLAMMLQTFRASKFLDLRTKARIFIPNGRAMMGCLDETRTLGYGQAFVQFSRARGGESVGNTQILKGKLIVAKNPCLHPGDVRVLQAMNVPALHHMVDCIVFPQKGKRPHSNECSGSDLDGDVYFVCWDPDLIPPRTFPPMDYTAAPTTTLDHDVTIEEVQEYFTDYLLNDSLGIICNAHTVFADRDPLMARSKECIELARLSSIAVDFPKTGVPAKIPQELRVKDYPDFMEKAAERTYESQRALGKLFRDVRDFATDSSPVRSFTKDMARRSYDPDMEVDGFRDHIEEAFHCKSVYDNKLGNMMDYYGIKTEAEIISGCIMKVGKSFDKKRDFDSINHSIRSLRKEARAWFAESDSSPDDLYAKASAWYYVTYHPSHWGRYNEGLNRVHFLSFPWCVCDKLIDIKKSKALGGRGASRLTPLVHRFSQASI